jgi:hypothetical protein
MDRAIEVGKAKAAGGFYHVVEAKADESKVSSRGEVGIELAGSDVAYRHDWGDFNGQVVLNLNWSLVNRNSLVFVSIGEGAGGGGKFIGSARYTVHNVAPRDGGVSVWVNIEWSSPIRLVVDYLVINNRNF